MIVDNSSGSVLGAGTVLRAGAGTFPRARTNLKLEPQSCNCPPN